MPIEYKINVKEGLVVSTASGIVTTEEFLDHEHSLARDKHFRPSFNQFADFRQVTSMNLTAEELDRIASVGPWSSSSRRAAVIPTDLFFGQARMYEVFNEMHGGLLLTEYIFIHSSSSERSVVLDDIRVVPWNTYRRVSIRYG